MDTKMPPFLFTACILAQLATVVFCSDGLDTYQVEIVDENTRPVTILRECVNKVSGTFFSINTEGIDGNRYIKYSVPDSQKGAKIDWEDVDGALDIFECDAEARREAAVMFYSEGQTCRLSRTLVYEYQDENTDPSTTTTVYVSGETFQTVPMGSCRLSNGLVLLTGSAYNTTLCGVDMQLSCTGSVLTELSGSPIVYAAPGGCIFLTNASDVYSAHASTCAQDTLSGTLCVPPSEDQRGDFIDAMREYLPLPAYVGLRGNETSSQWDNSVPQPNMGTINGWTSEQPIFNSAENCVTSLPGMGLEVIDCTAMEIACCFLAG